MFASASPRFRMRDATAGDHARVDAAFSSFALDSRAGYAAFLKAQAGAFLPVEAGIDRAGAERVLADWPARRRADRLRADLDDLGIAADEPAMRLPRFDGVEAVLGAIYVLEGSRLGGRVLARAVPDDLPRRFIGAGADAGWRGVVAVLDAELRTDVQLIAAIGAAHDVFARFEASAYRQTEAIRA